MTALVNELLRVPITDGEAVPDSNQIHVSGVAEPDEPEFFVREIGFFAADGTLFAVWSDPAQVEGIAAPWSSCCSGSI